MMSEEFIVRNEILNDGSSIHLYYSKMYEIYEAYGYSAFMVVQNCLMESIQAFPLKESYSDKFQMPMVKVNQEQMALIRSKGLVQEDSDNDGYIYIQSFIPFDERKYTEWAQMLRG